MRKLIYVVAILIIVLAMIKGIDKGNIITETENKYLVAGIEDSASFENTFKAIKEVIKEDNSEELEKYIIYPLIVHDNGKTIEIEDKEMFVNKYEEIVTNKIKESIINQKEEDLFVNYQGVMVGNGEVWLGALEDQSKYGIIVINK
ncbi:MAG: hypothetical protein N4A47_06940 [Clostridia bacterium]|jgi:ABC-type lipoprotein release transport system permease subunit|nr:hypothetical protein [Clostridia bacterium]